MEDQLTAPNVLSLFDTTHQQRVTFMQDIVERLQNGEGDPIKILAQIKSMEDIINGLTTTDKKRNKHFDLAKTFRKILMDEADKYGKTFELYNATFTKGEVGVDYDFPGCGDPEIISLLEQQAAINKLVAQRKEFLKFIPDGGIDAIDKSTGEVIKIYKPNKTSTTTLITKLK